MSVEFVEIRAKRSGAVHRPKAGPLIRIEVPTLSLKFYRHDTTDVFVEVYQGDKHLRTLEMEDEIADTFRKIVRKFVRENFPEST